MTKEMSKKVEELMELVEYGEGCEKACEKCPFAEQCKKEELFWGCGCWEKGMGDDL